MGTYTCSYTDWVLRPQVPVGYGFSLYLVFTLLHPSLALAKASCPQIILKHVKSAHTILHKGDTHCFGEAKRQLIT